MPAPVTNSTTICNSALLKIGADIISSLTDGTRAANVCNTLYTYLRDEVMGESPWRFALKSVVLGPNGTPPIHDYAFAYDIPSDCLRPLKMSDDSIEWAVEGSVIMTDEPSITLIYLYRNEDESSWDARFCEAFAWRLAMELALSVAQSTTLKQEAEKSYDKALANARAMNALIGTIPPLEADIWSRARKGYRVPR